MLTTKQKPLEKILEYLDGERIKEHLLVIAPDTYPQVRNCLQEIF